MQKQFIAAAATLALLGSTVANAAEEANPLISQNHCLSCHALLQKRVGPAFAWIAYRYRARRDAVNMLAEKVIRGGSGDWDAWTYSTPMPPHPELTQAQADAMVKWILAREPKRPPDPQ
ncbi:MAG: c-type cytochrome [Betaproteobacteria bacterium]|nr:c-type cytochrome [Betaproteobacteria bacterium]